MNNIPNYGPAPGSIPTINGTNTGYAPSSSLVFQNSDPNPTNTFSGYGSTSYKTHIPSNFTYSFPANTPAVLARPYQTPSSHFGEISAFNFSKTPVGSAPKISEFGGSNAWKVPSKLSIDYRPPVELQASYMQRPGNENAMNAPWLVKSLTDQKAQSTTGKHTLALNVLPYEPSIGNHKLSPYNYGQVQNLSAKTHDTPMDQFFRSYVRENPNLQALSIPLQYGWRMQAELASRNFMREERRELLNRGMERTIVNPQQDYFVSKEYDLRILQSALTGSMRTSLAQDPNYKSTLFIDPAQYQYKGYMQSTEFGTRWVALPNPLSSDPLNAGLGRTEPLSFSEFGKGFAKGLPKGIYDSGAGLASLASDLAMHPIDTGKQMWDAIHLLSDLVRSKEWEALGEALSPELHQLITSWDTLSSIEKGELTGYVVGKHGTDFIAPAALAKLAGTGLKVAQGIASTAKTTRAVQESLVLATAVKRELPGCALGKYGAGNLVPGAIESSIAPAIESIGAKKIEMISPHSVKFSQPTISQNFSGGRDIQDLINDLVSGKIQVSDVPVIRVVERGDELITLDNRRLAAFKAANSEFIPIERVSLTDPEIFKEFQRKFNPINEGNIIVIIPKASERKLEEINLSLHGKIK